MGVLSGDGYLPEDRAPGGLRRRLRLRPRRGPLPGARPAGKKRVVYVSFSFGDPARIGGEAPVVFARDGALVKRITAASLPDGAYGPEVHLASFLDQRFPDRAPHVVYACNARSFTVPSLSALYGELASAHGIDAAIIVDGGSDSLIRGDEEGLGDPVEDCVSVTAVAGLDGLRERILVTVGLGCDRYNQVSDAASLRAIAELIERRRSERD